MGYYISELSYDETITTTSPFPEWIHTDRIRFERLTENNLPPQELRNARAANSDFSTYFTTSRQHDTTYDSVLDWYEYANELWENRTDAFYVMFSPTTEEFLGMAYLEDVDFSRERGKLGIWLDEQHRGEGFSQARAEALITVAFDHLNLKLIEVEVVPENTASVKSVEKYMREFGGRFDGRIRRATHTPNNGVHDLYKWSISKEEFTDENATYDPTVEV